MALGMSLLAVAAVAILIWSVGGPRTGVDLEIVGLIGILVGSVGFALTLAARAQRLLAARALRDRRAR